MWFDGLNRFYVTLELYAALQPHFRLPPNVFDDFTLPDRDSLPQKQVRPRDVLEAATPPTLNIDQRVAVTLRCRDADSIPKVPGAGSIQREPDGTRIQLMHNGLKVLADGYYGTG